MEPDSRRSLLTALLAGAIAVIGVAVASSRPVVIEEVTPQGLGGVALLLIGGTLAVRSVARSIRQSLERRGAGGRGAALGLIASIAGYVLLALTALPLIGLNLEGLLLGGALTGVAIGIAAQQTLGNFFAGIVLLLVRPFSVGQRVVFRSGALGGEYEGLVTDMGLFYVDLLTERGPVALPNAGVLASAVGPGARTGDPDEPEEGAEEADGGA